MGISYDDNAFSYFLVSILSLYIFPGGYFLIKKILNHHKKNNNNNKTKNLIDINSDIIINENINKLDNNNNDNNDNQNNKKKKKKKNKKNKKNDNENDDNLTIKQRKLINKVAEEAEKVIEKESKLFKPGFILYICFYVFCVYLFYILVMGILSASSNIEGFNPYEILGIEHGATVKEIKKAYRQLAIKLHPDKNLDDPFAEERFIKLSKAHQALTDDTARENYEKYGNPDGPQAMEVSIGLPTFLLDENNQGLVLILYLLGLVIIIPSFIAYWYNKNKQLGRDNVMNDTYIYFMQFIRQKRPNLRMMPQVFAGAKEFRTKIFYNEAEQTELEIVEKKTRSGRKLKINTFNNNVKIYLLLQAHLQGCELSQYLTHSLANDILKPSQPLLNALITASIYDKTLPIISSAIKFNQFFIQGLWMDDSPFRQLPYFDDVNLKGAKKNAFIKFLSHPSKTSNILRPFTDEEKDEVIEATNNFPRVNLQTRVFVEGEKDICEKDLITLEYTIERLNLAQTLSSPKKKKKNKNKNKNNKNHDEEEKKDNDNDNDNDNNNNDNKENNDDNTPVLKAPPVYSLAYPFPRKEAWWIFLFNPKGILVFYKKLENQDMIFKDDIKFAAPPKQGTYTFEMHLMSDSYIGLDTKTIVSIKVKSAKEVVEEDFHPEDLAIVNAPSLFEQLSGGAAFDENWDNEDDENNDEDNDEDQLDDDGIGEGDEDDDDDDDDDDEEEEDDDDDDEEEEDDDEDDDL